MRTIKLNTCVGEDGMLRLELPVGVVDEELEVLVVVQPREKRGWPPGFFEETASSLQATPLERPPQGEYEARDSLT